ncbi:MAG: hypothetical protein N2053_12025 [Chitinispirillaceae bacterium]|nr:hypothetical protein [Chitinispirillaceae bacterium]
MSFLIKCIELVLIFIIITSILKMGYKKPRIKRNSFKDEKVPFDVKEQDVVDADYEEIE